MGLALREKSGFAKATVDGENGKILGFHTIGPEAPTPIREVVNVIASDGTMQGIRAGMHIHPAMSELVESALVNLSEPGK